MRKKTEYTPPTEIIVDGKIIKMHSSREERLRMSPVSSARQNTSIFAAENRPRLILMLALIIITMVGTLLSSYFMKNKECMLDGIKVTMMRKNYDMGHMQTFRIQLKNTTNETVQMKENYLFYFKLVNKDTGEIYFPKKEPVKKKDNDETEPIEEKEPAEEIILTKLTYNPMESFQEDIHITDIPDGSYVATWTIPTLQDFNFSFKVGRKRR